MWLHKNTGDSLAGGARWMHKTFTTGQDWLHKTSAAVDWLHKTSRASTTSASATGARLVLRRESG